MAAYSKKSTDELHYEDYQRGNKSGIVGLSRQLGRRIELWDMNSIEACEELEKLLKLSLECVDERKTSLRKTESQKEQRLCAVCLDNEKSVVLIPCRHLCLCESCSNYSQLGRCPLCMNAISSKLSVFS